MRLPHPGLAVVAVTAALLTSACGSLSPGHAAAEEFEEHFTSAYPDVVLEAVTTAADKWPLVGGQMGGSLVLADDTPPDLLESILEEVLTWQTGENASYDGVGVMANGLCLTPGDEQQDLKLALRDRLYAEGLALQGAWGCPSWLGGTSLYSGTVAQLAQDSATVSGLWSESDGALRLVANVNEPYGTVDRLWADVPESLPDVLTAIGQEHAVKTFELTDSGLRVAVAATTRLPELQEIADGLAGADLVVEVMQGSLDAEKATQIEGLADVADEVRTVPGVLGVDVQQPLQLVVAVEDAAAVRAVHETATAHPDLGSASLQITLDAADPDDEWARHRYFWQPGGSDEALQAFLDLAASPSVSFVQLTNGAEPRASVDLAVPLADGFATLKDLVPDGMSLSVTGSDALASVEFTAARTLDPDDLQTRFTTPDLGRLARDWNAAGTD